MSHPYRFLGLWLLPLLRWRISRVEGIENLPRGGYIIVPNHQSWVDSPLLVSAIYRHLHKSLRFIAQSSKYRFLGGIPINEYDKSQALEVAAGYLRVGHPILIYPEGNSNRSPELRAGQTGAARLALISGAPLVPVGIRGTRGVSAWSAIFLWYFAFWKHCAVTIGQPFSFPKEDVDDIPHQRLVEVTDEIMEKISAVSGKPYHPGRQPPPLRVSWMDKFIRKSLYPFISPRIIVGGAENLPMKGPFIVAGNHQSYADPPALAGAVMKVRKIQPRFLTKLKVVKFFSGLVGRGGVKAMGMLPVDTSNRQQALFAAESFLRRGGVIAIFPEGTRNTKRKNPHWETTLLKGKTGIARLNLTTQTPVYPVGIEVPDGHGVWQALKMLFQVWRRVTVTFGPAVKFQHVPPSLEAATKHDLELMTKDIMFEIGKLCGKKYPF